MEIKNPILLKHGLVSISQKQKYDRFIQLYMISYDAKKSYSQVSDTTNDKTIESQSYRLMKHPYVISQIQKKNKAMEEKMDEKALMTREKVLEELQLILEQTKADKNHNVSLKAINQISKVIDAYASVKQEVTHKGVTINYNKPDKNA
tara:strand:- start:105 stop:548 length:444 start_codon:yes stop_codon:yes gene_type:complete